MLQTPKTAINVLASKQIPKPNFDKNKLTYKSETIQSKQIKVEPVTKPNKVETPRPKQVNATTSHFKQIKLEPLTSPGLNRKQTLLSDYGISSSPKNPRQEEDRSHSEDSDSSGKRKTQGAGCRCGNATLCPGKLTCCGQRCPCYVDSQACVDCRCKGCRNPHLPGGGKVRPALPRSPGPQVVPPVQATVRLPVTLASTETFSLRSLDLDLDSSGTSTRLQTLSVISLANTSQ